jgi:cytidylate kinase
MAARTTPSQRPIIVALDGPASSGKSSVGSAAAAQLGLRFVDTGLFYRALTALALREGVALDDAPSLVGLVDRVSLADDGTGRMTRVLLDGVDATDEARGATVDSYVSTVARQPAVRAALLERQRELAAVGGIVLAGRDIGTVVLPDADLKVYLDASVEERAKRRIDERGLDPAGDDAEEVREQLRIRDAIDTGREVAPLRAADDAVHIVTDGNEFAETVEIVAAEIARVMLTPRKRTRARAPSSRRKPGAASAIALVDPGPFSTAAAVAPKGIDPFRVAYPAEEPASPAAAPAPVLAEAAPAADPGPFGVAAAVAPAGADPFRVGYPREEGAPPTEPEVAPRPVPTARPVTAIRAAKRPTILETAMRLDNGQTMLVRMVALVSRIGARAFANVEVEGLERIPRTGAVILAINHISNADPVVAGAWISDALVRRRIHWLGKKELFDWPIFGWMAANGGVHPVDRDSADVEAFRLATRILEKGYVLLVFPEGTRSPTGELQEAKDGVAMLALRTGAQIVPVGVSNSDAVWKKSQRFPMPFPRQTVRVRIGTPFRVQDVIPEGTDRRTAKTIATTEIMGRIAGLVDARHRGVYADAIREARTREP